MKESSCHLTCSEVEGPKCSLEWPQICPPCYGLNTLVTFFFFLMKFDREFLEKNN